MRDGSGKERPRRVRAIGLLVVTRYGRRRGRVAGLSGVTPLPLLKGPSSLNFLRYAHHGRALGRDRGLPPPLVITGLEMEGKEKGRRPRCGSVPASR